MGPSRYEHGQESKTDGSSCSLGYWMGVRTNKSPWQEELFEQLGKKAELRREGPLAGSEALVLPGYDGKRGLWA